MQGGLRRQLHEVFPDLDPDVVGEVLELTGIDEVPAGLTDRQGEK